MRIIPAMDIINGQCVRLTKGDYNTKKVYSANPLEIAKEFEDAGIEYLHLVDLDGAKAKQIVNLSVLETIANNTRLKIDFGGGIKTLQSAEDAFNAGANQITAGSIAATDPDTTLSWLKQFGPEKIILGADAKSEKIVTHGWQNKSNLDVLSFIQNYVEKGIQYTIVTDTEKDGALQGPSIQLYQRILSKTKVKLIASGGISTIDDLKKLKEIGCEGAIIGKAIYEGKIKLEELVELC